MRKVAVVIGVMVLSLWGSRNVKSPYDLQRINKVEDGAITTGSGQILITPCDTIEPHIPDIRALLGCPGKNIAVKGDTVVAITGPYSGDPDNIFGGVYAYYSFDKGQTWQSFALSTSLNRRIYPGVIWPDAAGRTWSGSPSPLFFWHEAYRAGGVYQPSRMYIAWDIAWPSGIFWVVELPNSYDLNVWLPSADAKGDTIIVTGVNVSTSFQSFYWLSYDGGQTWQVSGQPINTATDVDNAIPRIGNTPGYMAAIMEVYNEAQYPWGAYVPYFGESTDGGMTWTWYSLWDLAHGGNAPYDSCAGGWWYVYDFVLDSDDRPLIVWKYGKGTYEYGDVWFYKPTQGSPGNWSGWTYQLIAGDGQGGNYATQPYISIDPISNAIFLVWNGYFIVGTDTFNHLWIQASMDRGNTWYLDTLWPGYDSFQEEAAELPVYSPSYGGSVDLHLSFCNRSTAAGDPALHSLYPAYISVKEKAKISLNGSSFSVKNKGRDLVINFSLPEKEKVELSIYNSAGRKISTIYKGDAISEKITYKANKLTPGIYFIRLNSSTKTFTSKILLP